MSRINACRWVGRQKGWIARIEEFSDLSVIIFDFDWEYPVEI